jgi:outer membrane protein OmpA-like peptidoglycan-associated protein
MRANTMLTAGALGSLLLAQGCVATRDWVKEQMDPVSNRVSQSESRLTQTENQIGTMGNRISGVEGKLGQFEGRLGQVDAKADKALNAISNLRLERRFVVDMKEGANFAFGSSNLPNQAQKEIDGFLSDLKGDPSGTGNTVFVVAGHTDNVGTEDVNYNLAKRRADAVSRYLITQKKVDPLKVVSVSYGESAPLTENNNAQNRAKNRRVEILVYREGITSEAMAAAPQSNSPASQSETLSKRQ